MNCLEIIAKHDLTVSIVPRSELGQTFRIDAEHYQPHFIQTIQLLQAKPNKLLKELVTRTITTGHTPSMKEVSFYGGSIKLVKTNNLRENDVTENFDHFLTEEGNKEIKKSELQPDDVIVTIIGATFDIIGRAARVFSDLGRANINQNIGLIRSTIPAGYLTSFLNSNHGRQQLYYLSRQTEQVNLNCAELGDLIIPLPSKKLIEEIHNLHTRAHGLRLSSKIAMRAAENLLLQELGIADVKQAEKNISIRSVVEAIQANRLDAEYWQPKYDELLQNLTAFAPQTLAELCTIQRGALISMDYYQETDGTPYLRGGDFSSGKIASESLVHIRKDFHDTKIPKLATGDIIFASIGSVGTSAVITQEFSGSFFSNNTGGLRIKNMETISPEYLQVVLHSLVGKMQFERLSTQTAQPKISNDDMGKIVVPVLPKMTQKFITDSAILSRKKEIEAKTLIDLTKRAVEVFIEKDEDAALKVIEAA